MEGSRSGGWGRRYAAALAVALVAGFVSFFVSTASSGAAPPPPPTSLGSQWYAHDGVLDTNGVTDIPDPSGHADTSNYNEGASEDTICPAVQAGTAANKDDVDHVYFGVQATTTTVYTYMAWHRIATNGTTTIDFELNHSGQLKTNCNGYNIARQAGDILVSYDFQGSGPFTIDISFSRWVGDANAGTWVAATPPLSTTAHDEGMSPDGAFGELVMDLDLAGVLTRAKCDTFSDFFVKTRSSSQNFSNTIKDFVPPQTANISNCGGIKIHKQDDAHAAMSGVQFDLYTDVNGAQGVPVVPAVSCTTDAGGDCTMSNIEVGTYWVVEHAVPAGHTGAAPQKVTVAADTVAPLTFENPRIPATINVTKIDDNSDPVAGAIFTLYTNSSNAPGTATSYQCTSNAAGTCSMTNVLVTPGTYWVVETSTPAGYDTASPASVQVDYGGTASVTMTDTRQPATVNILKTDDADPANALSGADFALYTDDSGAPGSAVAGKTCTTDAQGACSIGNILPPATYWVVETKTPAGHDTAPAQSVTLGLNSTVSLTFVDPRQPATINILKYDGGTNPLAGAEFSLLSGGQLVSGKVCTTSAQGTCSIGGILVEGDYVVRETKTPDGYTTAADQAVNGLTFGETRTLTFHDPVKSIGVSLVKNVNGEHSTEADPLLVESGDTVTYTATIKNTGDLPLTITALSDTLNGDFASACPQAVGSTLDVGADFTCTYDSAITDPAHNVASVSATDVLERTATASDEVFVQPINPAISLSKTGPSAAHVGDVVTYTFMVGNLGDTGLSDVTLTDARCAAAPTLTAKANGNQDDVLDPSETWTYTCKYTVTAADDSSVKNTANVSGMDVLEKTVTAAATYTFPVLHPAIAIDKTANPTSVTDSGPVTYTYVVTNVGDTTLFNIVVSDDVIGAIGTIDQLAAGASSTLTKTVTVTTSTTPTNVGTAAGTDVLGQQVSASDSATISVVLGEVITRPAPVAPVTLPRTGAMIRREAGWAALFIGLGLALVATTRRRRTTTS